MVMKGQIAPVDWNGNSDTKPTEEELREALGMLVTGDYVWSENCGQDKAKDHVLLLDAITELVELRKEKEAMQESEKGPT